MSESHERQFTGVWVPAYIFDLVEEGKINGTDVLLLALINSYSKKKEGCYASNEFLGEKAGISADQACRVVSKLKSLGLVKQVGFDGRKRYLRTPQMEAPEPVAGSGKSPSLSREEIPACHGEKSDIYKDYNKADNKGDNSVTQRSQLSPGFLNKGDSNGEQKPSIFKELADEMFNFFKVKGKIPGVHHNRGWAKKIEVFVREGLIAKKRFLSVWNWYKAHMGEEFVSEAYSASGFCEKFIRIEAAMDKAAPSEDEIDAEKEQKWQEWQRVNEEVGALYVQVYQPEDGETIDKEKKEQLKREHFPQYDHISLLERPK